MIRFQILRGVFATFQTNELRLEFDADIDCSSDDEMSFILTEISRKLELESDWTSRRWEGDVLVLRFD